MNSGSFRYLFKQGFASVWLNRVMSLASVAILTACLVIVGGAGLLSYNVQDVFVELQSQTEMMVYIKDDAKQDEITGLGNQLRALEYVKDVTFVSKDEALDIMRESMGDEKHLLEGLEEDNPLPACYKVSLNDLTRLDEAQRKILQMSAVDSISAPTQLAEQLVGIERTLVIVGGIIIGILLIASVVVISNTIKLTVFSRRREINIMRYVGATNGFIRLPFVVEGLTLGFFAAVFAFLIILFTYQSLAGLLSGSIAWLSATSDGVAPFWDVWYWVLGGFLLSGMLIGAFGSSSAMRKHLQV